MEQRHERWRRRFCPNPAHHPREQLLRLHALGADVREAQLDDVVARFVARREVAPHVVEPLNRAALLRRELVQRFEVAVPVGVIAHVGHGLERLLRDLEDERADKTLIADAVARRTEAFDPEAMRWCETCFQPLLLRCTAASVSWEAILAGIQGVDEEIGGLPIEFYAMCLRSNPIRTVTESR